MRRPSRSGGIVSYVSAGLVFALCAWAWIAPPAWLVPKPVAAPSREYREASTRVALALHAQRIEAYRSSHGRLPRTKQEVGIASDQIIYDRSDSLNFQLTSMVDGVERQVVPWPDWAITTVLDTRQFCQTVWRAVSCHESQMTVYTKLQDLAPEHFQALFGTQWFYRVFSRVNGGRARERDLFEGIRS